MTNSRIVLLIIMIALLSLISSMFVIIECSPLVFNSTGLISTTDAAAAVNNHSSIARSQTVDLSSSSLSSSAAAGTAMNVIGKIFEILASLFIIFGGIIPYIPQYKIINDTRSAHGFSTFVCLAIFVSSILRVLFWFGHPFELPLLAQCAVMIAFMLVMLELCVRTNRQQQLEQNKRKITDFNPYHFWRWSDLTSYLVFLTGFTLVGAVVTKLLIWSRIYVETLGFASIIIEVLLGLPQFYKNYKHQSTDGMSLSMVIMWMTGDLMKTLYFVLKNSPVQFWVCGFAQVSINFAILFQVVYYRNKSGSGDSSISRSNESIPT